MKIWLAADPGKAGAIAYIKDTGEKKAFPTPTIGKEYDRLAVRDLLVNIKNTGADLHFVIENINSHSAKGRQTAFVMGKGVEMWFSMAVALDIPYTAVAPQTWQKEMWQGIQKQKNSKATSLIAVKGLFPTFDLTATDKATIPHDGIVDALLMAEYCRRKF